MRFAILFTGLIAVSFTAGEAHAYVGPGAGIGALGAIIGIIAAVFLSILAIALWPLRKLLRGKRKPETADASADARAQ
jgi:hypothetical protein